MKKTMQAMATLSMIVAAVGGVTVLGAGTANAAGMTHDQCVKEAARKQAAYDSRRAPDATHATYVKYYCREAGVDTSDRKLYEVTYSENAI
ncbi:hypothetical protein [Nocardia brasiliensis]|uniref:hypothetical protein n=1 Tax=Nocardia brasiliensis TaxID=37326 RepID=UPI0033C07958